MTGLVGLFGLASCLDGSDSSGPSTPGELPGGRFIYVCAGGQDAFCRDGETAEKFPNRFATEGHFALRYADDDGSIADVRAASGDVISQNGDIFTPHKAGAAAVWAVGKRGQTVNLLHLEVADIHEAVVVHEDNKIDSISIEAGETRTLRGEAHDLFDLNLAGSLPYQWSITDESVARLVTAADDNDVEIEAVGEGVTTLRMEVAGVSQEIEVRVGEDSGGSETGTSGGSQGDDSSSGTGGGSDSESGSDDSTGGSSSSTGGQ